MRADDEPCSSVHFTIFYFIFSFLPSPPSFSALTYHPFLLLLFLPSVHPTFYHFLSITRSISLVHRLPVASPCFRR